MDNCQGMVDKLKSDDQPYVRISVLAKAPHIGKVKTRLTTALSHWQTLRFHQWSLCEVIERICPQACDSPPLLFVTHQHPFWSELPIDGLALTQCDGSLGLRMRHALIESFDRINQDPSLQDAVLLLGTDSPNISPEWLKEGLDYLSGESDPTLAIGPAEDGGYYTIGCNRAALALIDQVFINDICWGTSEVFQKSIDIAAQLGVRVYRLPLGFDIDEPADLLRSQEDPTPRWALYKEQTKASILSVPSKSELRLAYETALSKLFALTRFGERFDLSGPHAINQALNNPLTSFKSILIGGTNGKGSTCSVLNQLAQQTDQTVGCFTSPHLVSFRERIRIGADLVSHQEVIEGVDVVLKAAESVHLHLSFFEATWALAAWFFRKRQVDWVIWEVGLGGRLDATNTCEPVLSAISSISLDHTHILGNSLEAIAKEKMHIYRKGNIALTACEGTALEALIKVSKVVPDTIEEEIEEVAEHTHTFVESDCGDRSLYDQRMVKTDHGKRNVALAWAIAKRLRWFDVFPQNALDMKWPGRLEHLEGVWLDCAHNPDSALQITQWLEHHSRPRHLIIGMSEDKAITEVLLRLATQCERMTFVSPRYPRCVTAEQLAKYYTDAMVTNQKNIRLDQTLDSSPQPIIEVIPSLIQALCQRDIEALTLVTGSCFLVGEARAWLLGVDFPELGISTIAR